MPNSSDRMTRKWPVLRWRTLLLLIALLVVAWPKTSARAQGSRPASAAPADIVGQINGKTARFASQGDDVLVSAAEADRLGVSYRQKPGITIGGTTLWQATLASVTIGNHTRLNVRAGVVPSIEAYITALRANPAEALMKSRRLVGKVDGRDAEMYDMGIGGILLPLEEAERLGLRSRLKAHSSGAASRMWLLEGVPVQVGGQNVSIPLLVGDPRGMFEAGLRATEPPRR